MLILSRKLSEQIVIGDGIVVTVIAIRGGNVRLGIDAPKSVAVHRKEVYDSIHRQPSPQTAKSAVQKADSSAADARPGE
jgi:carbon storage regulator